MGGLFLGLPSLHSSKFLRAAMSDFQFGIRTTILAVNTGIVCSHARVRVFTIIDEAFVELNLECFVDT